jgi:Family of unknown function (DUF6352)
VRDYWSSCGYRLLVVGSDGRLTLTDDFLRAHLLRPELAPIPESSAPELALHDALIDNPRRTVSAREIEAIDDADARDNYRIWLKLRARLLNAGSVEAAYAGLFRGDVDVPPLFVQQLTQVIVRHILGADADPLEARAGEMLFRTQRIAVRDDGTVMAADEATVETYATSGGFGSLGELLSRNKMPTRSVELDVLDAESSSQYWDRDERFDFAVSLNLGAPVLAAFTRVLEKWIAHFLAVGVTIRPQREIDDAKWVWHVGLDAEASGLLNDLYNRVDVEEARLARLLCLFQLDFADASAMRPAIAGRPVYLAMAMDADNRLRLKPQNLLLNLPLSQMQ